MKNISIAICLLLSGCANSLLYKVEEKALNHNINIDKNNIHIAILPMYDDGNNEFSRVVVSSFLSAGWNVIDRSVIDKILEEQKLQLSGAIDRNSVKIGKLVGANFVCSGAGMRRINGDGVIDMRIINVETGEVVASSACSGTQSVGRCAAAELVKLINKK